ncbi:barstar family protein [Empedobacter sedimenti]|uniref:barstar family protein n=1 Tax=Empedobacter sedimenti TaxID=3042610 RepID=UPI0024A79C31|nr:barstar family protein [Empedobacter sedimenti]
MMNKKVIVINGNNFSDLTGFYNEIERVLTKDLDWKIGRNLDAFEDILLGGYGVFETGEPIQLIWENSTKSKADLGFEATKKFYEEKISAIETDAESLSYFEKELDKLLHHNGKSLFDTILEIISHRQIEFKARN